MKKLLFVLNRFMVAAVVLVAVAGAQAQGDMSGSSKRYSLYGAGNSYVSLNLGQSDFSVDRGMGLFGSEDRDTAYGIYTGSFFHQTAPRPWARVTVSNRLQRRVGGAFLHSAVR